MRDRLNAQRNPYTPTSPQLLGPGLQAELEQLEDLTPAQLETVLAYAAQDGRLDAIIQPTGITGRGLLHFQTLELATGLAYEHKLEPTGGRGTSAKPGPATAGHTRRQGRGGSRHDTPEQRRSTTSGETQPLPGRGRACRRRPAYGPAPGLQDPRCARPRAPLTGRASLTGPRLTARVPTTAPGPSRRRQCSATTTKEASR